MNSPERSLTYYRLGFEKHESQHMSNSECVVPHCGVRAYGLVFPENREIVDVSWMGKKSLERPKVVPLEAWNDAGPAARRLRRGRAFGGVAESGRNQNPTEHETCAYTAIHST